MTVFSGPEQHAANPPETWVVVKVADHKWQLQDAQGTRLHYGTTKRECEYAREVGFIRNLYDKEARWYAGESITGWKTWAECKAERDAIAATVEA